MEGKIQKRRNQNGSITVEAAIAVPIFICVFVSIIFLIKIVYVHEIIQHAITEVADEVASYSYIYHITKDDTQITQSIDSIINSSELGLNIRMYFEKYSNIKAFQPFIKTLVLQQIENQQEEDIKKQLDKLHIINGADGLDFSKSTFLLDNKHVDVIVRYKIKLPLPIDILPDIQIMQRAFVRAWLDGDGETLYSGNEDSITSSVWDLPPMQRGKEIQQIYGRDKLIPHNFPVIAKFEKGKATSIKSINLTDATYQKSSNVKYKVKGFINDLAMFNGGKVREYEIKESQIIQKELIVVVPKDSVNTELHTVLAWCKGYAKSKGIILTVKEL